MKVCIDLEEEILIVWDQGKRDIILTLKQATDGIEAFEIDIHMDMITFNQLKKEIEEFSKGE